MRRLELRRHAKRDPDADKLSAPGRAQAEDVGRSSGVKYEAVFVSPAERAAETAAWILRGAGQQLPPGHAVIPGLAGRDETGGGPGGGGGRGRAPPPEGPPRGRAPPGSPTPLVGRAK